MKTRKDKTILELKALLYSLSIRSFFLGRQSLAIDYSTFWKIVVVKAEIPNYYQVTYNKIDSRYCSHLTFMLYAESGSLLFIKMKNSGVFNLQLLEKIQS